MRPVSADLSPQDSGNLAGREIDYAITETASFVTKVWVYPSGQGYTERISKASLMGWPLVHITLGRCPETGRRKVAKGWLAIGRFAVGGIALGQVAAGLIAVSQLGFGAVLALGQASFGGQTAVGQLAVARTAAYGQVAVAREEAVGQLAVARFALGQIGLGSHVVDSRGRDPEAMVRFAPLIDELGLTIAGDLPAEAPDPDRPAAPVAEPPTTPGSEAPGPPPQ